VKLHEHYHNRFLQPAFPMLIMRLASFGHPIQFYPSSSTLPPACLSYAHRGTCQFRSSNTIVSIFVYTRL
jgi:hypothetical protein